MPETLQFLTEDAHVICQHELGVVKIEPGQSFVTVAGRRVLTAKDPESRPIGGCPNYGVTIKPCTSTLPVKQGYSTFITIADRAVCLSTVRGLTDGTPPGGVDYFVRTPGQTLVTSQA